jgi:predicted Zn-dependent protease
MTAGPAFFFDGSGAKRIPVTVEVRADTIAILADGSELAIWRLADLHAVDAPRGLLRLGAEGAAELARLEVRDGALQEALRAVCPNLVGRRRGGEATARQIVLWSLAATISVVLTAMYLVPLLADRLAPFVPVALERRIGEAVDNQVRAIFGSEACSTDAGDNALTRLQAQLTQVADLPMPADVVVLKSEIVNAVALPGGRVYVFEGLLKAADNADEVAGVVAHEFGHVAGRDGLRRILETGGTSFLLGLLLGDVSGGGAVIFAAQTLVDSRYSRELFLNRIDTNNSAALAFISSHPVTSERIRALEANDQPTTGAPLLSNAEWQALKGICG